MKRLKTELNGGLLFFAEHFRYADQAIREGFYALISAWGVSGQESFILAGCVITANHPNYSWTEGYICKGGVIYRVPAGSIITATVIPASYAIAWDELTIFDTAGDVVFENGTSQSIYEEKILALAVLNTAAFPNYMPYNAPTIHERIAAKITAKEEAFQNITGINHDWAQGDTSFNTPLQIKRDLFNTVHLSGKITSVTANPNISLFVLPLIYRPTRNLIIPAVLNNKPTVISINTGGGVTLLETGLVDVNYTLCFAMSYKIQ